MALPRGGRDWSGEIRDAVIESGALNGVIRIYKAGSTQPGAHDPYAGSGGEPDVELILGPRDARAQHLRLPVESNDGLGWTTRRRYRFQYQILDGDDDITGDLVGKGYSVRFTGGKDPSLQHFSFQVLSAVNSSHAALRTLECITEAGPSSEPTP